MANRRKFDAVGIFHDDSVEREIAGVSGVVHLIEHVRGLTEWGSVRINGGSGPGARVALLVSCADVEFDNGVVRLRRNGCGKNAVVRGPVTVQAVIKHRKRVEYGGVVESP